MYHMYNIFFILSTYIKERENEWLTDNQEQTLEIVQLWIGLNQLVQGILKWDEHV